MADDALLSNALFTFCRLKLLQTGEVLRDSDFAHQQNSTGQFDDVMLEF